MAIVFLNGSTLADLGGVLRLHSMHGVKARTEPDSCNFEVGAYAPTAQSEVIVTKDDGVTRIFGGIILGVNSIRMGRGHDREADWAVECGSFSHLLQRHTITQRFPVQAAGQTIRDMIAADSPEIDTTNVQDGPVFPVIAWNDYPLTLIDRLAKLLGWYWRVDAYKRLWFGPRATVPAPEDLTDTSRNFDELQLTVDAKTVRNAITIHGGMVPSTATVTDHFVGTGLTGQYKLSYEPYSTAVNPLLKDEFSPRSDYHPDPNLWTETDITNPSPPSQPDFGKPPITGTDGYILVDNFGFERGAAQFVDVLPAAFGTVGILSAKAFSRAEGRYLLATFRINTAGNFVPGFFDGIGVNTTDCLYGLSIENGAFHIYEAGARIALTGKTNATGTDYSLRITLKDAGGALYEIQGGTYGTWGGRDWTTLRDSNSGTTALLYAGAIKATADVSLYEMRIADPVLGMSVVITPDLAAPLPVSVLGLSNIDTAQVDALVDPKAQLLRYFSDNMPPKDSDVAVTYHRPVPIRWDTPLGSPAIQALAALTGETGPLAGVRHYQIKDTKIVHRDEAMARAQQELDLWALPVRKATWISYVDGYEPDQAITITSTPEGIDQAFALDRVDWEVWSGDDVKYTVEAGSSLLSVADYLAQLMASQRSVDLDLNQALEYGIVGTDTLRLTETVTRLSTAADITGTEALTLTETIDELSIVGPYVAAKYGQTGTNWGRCIYV